MRRYLLAQRGITQLAIARQADVSPSTVSRVLDDKVTNVTIQHLICELTGKSYSEMWTASEAVHAA